MLINFVSIVLLMDEKLLRGVAKGAGITFLGLIFGKFMTFVYRVILAKLLTPTEYGLFFLGIAVVTALTSLLIGGFPQGVRRYVAFFRGKKDEARIKGVIKDGILVVGTLSILGSVLVFIFAGRIAEIFGEPALAPVLSVLAWFVPTYAFFMLFRAVIDGFTTIKYSVFTEFILEKSANLVFATTAIVWGLGIAGVAVAQVVSWALALLLSVYFIEKKIFPLLKSKVKSIKSTREYLAFSFPIFISSSINGFSHHIDTLMIGFFFSAVEVGIYNVTLPIALLLGTFLFSLQKVFHPMASELFGSGDSKKLALLYSSTTKWGFMLALPFFILFFSFPSQIIRTFFGSAYESGALVLSILAVGQMARTIVGPATGLIISSGRSKLNLANVLFFAVVNISLNYIFIPTHGVVGAAAATAFSFALFGVILLVEVKHFMGFHPYNWGYLRLFLSGIVAMGVTYAGLKVLFPVVSIWTAFAGSVLFFVLYTVLAVLFRSFGSYDIVILKAMENRVGMSNVFSKRLMKFQNPSKDELSP